MPEVIIDGRGAGSTLVVNPDGSINVLPLGIAPNASGNNNFALTLIYSGTVIGSIVKFDPNNGSYVKVLTYNGSDQLTGIGSWV